MPPAGAEGNFIIGPTHNPAPETIAKEGVPRGTTKSFTLSSKESTIYNPGLIRDDVAGCTNSSIMTTTAPDDKSHMIVTTSHPGIWSRTIDVYVPAQYVRGTEAPFIVVGDGGSNAYKDLARRSKSDRAAPRAADDRDPDRQWRAGRAGQPARPRIRCGVRRLRAVRRARGAAAGREERRRQADQKPRRARDHGPELERLAAFTMAWFYPDLYHRVLAFSPTMVNQQWPHDPSLRGGAWEYHSVWTGPADTQPHRQGRRAHAGRAARRAADRRARRPSRSASGSSAATRTCSIRTRPFPTACTTGPCRTR